VKNHPRATANHRRRELGDEALRMDVDDGDYLSILNIGIVLKGLIWADYVWVYDFLQRLSSRPHGPTRYL